MFEREKFVEAYVKTYMKNKIELTNQPTTKHEAHTDPSVNLPYIIRHALRLSWTLRKMTPVRYLSAIIHTYQKSIFSYHGKRRSLTLNIMPSKIKTKQSNPRVLIDITNAAFSSKQSGIQRVVREFALAAHERGVGVPIIILDGRAWSAYGDRRHLIEARATDRLLLLDPNLGLEGGIVQFIASLKKVGGLVVPFIHDIIPLQFPEFWTEKDAIGFEYWLNFSLENANAIMTSTMTVANDLYKYRAASLSSKTIGYCHLACEIKTFSECGISDKLAKLSVGAPFFISVGTVEPRKGLEIVLNGFELLWSEGSLARLVILGRIGWGMAHFVERMRCHPELGTRLIWIDDASDADIRFAYQTAEALIFASLAEGFGLPIIEAAQFELPVIASNIATFREIAKYADITFFEAANTLDLARTIRNFRSHRRKKGKIAKILTWTDFVEAVTGMLRSEKLFAKCSKVVTWEDCCELQYKAVSYNQNRTD